MKNTLIAMVSILLTGFFFGAQSHELEGCQAYRPSASYEMEIISEGRRRTVYHRNRRSFVEGRVGERYAIRVHNRTGRRVEALISVDGRDAIDGRTASLMKRGYVIPAYSFIDVDGFRLSMHEVAAFRFTSANRSYAAQTGTPWTVGAVSVALFPEYGTHPPLRPGQPYVDNVDKSSDFGSTTYNLGTEFGERRVSPVTETSFVRENWNNPAARLTVRYDDSKGLCSVGVDAFCPPPYQPGPPPYEPLSDDRFSTPPPGWEHFTTWY